MSDDAMYRATLMDGSEYCFPLTTYKRLPVMYGAIIKYQRIKPHRRHPEEIHIDLFGLITFYYPENAVCPGGKYVEQIKAFYDGENFIKFYNKDDVIVGS